MEVKGTGQNPHFQPGAGAHLDIQPSQSQQAQSQVSVLGPKIQDPKGPVSRAGTAQALCLGQACAHEHVLCVCVCGCV